MLTENKLRALAYAEARLAGLTAEMSDACATRVVERVKRAGFGHVHAARPSLTERAIREEIQKAAKTRANP